MIHYNKKRFERTSREVNNAISHTLLSKHRKKKYADISRMVVRLKGGYK
jgi:hypothetical protein